MSRRFYWPIYFLNHWHHERCGGGKSPPKCILKKWVREDSLFENRLLWVVICGWWISIRFVCFCALTLVAFEPLNSVACVFEKRGKFFISLKFFLSSFLLKHGKFRFEIQKILYIKENKGRYKESTIRRHSKNLSPKWDSYPRPSTLEHRGSWLRIPSLAQIFPVSSYD